MSSSLSLFTLQSIYHFMQLSALSVQSQLHIHIYFITIKCISGRIERLVIMDERVSTFAYKEVSQRVSQSNWQKELLILAHRVSDGGEFTREWRPHRRVPRVCVSHKMVPLQDLPCGLLDAYKTLGGKLGCKEFQETFAPPNQIPHSSWVT